MDDLKKKSLVLAVVIALIMVVAVGGAVAIYGIRSPDSDPLQVNPTPTPVPQATLSKVSFPTTSITVGDTVTLTTIVSDASAGLTVDFYNQNGALVGSTTTNSLGSASITVTPPIGTWVYHANTSHP
jgi:hypothetical protein